MSFDLGVYRKYPHSLGRVLGYTKLLPIHSYWILRTFLSKEDILLLAHRGSFKTSALVVGLIWTLLFYSDTRILYASETMENARAIVKEAKSHYEQGYLRNIYSLLGVQEPRNFTKWRNQAFSLTTKQRKTKESNIECIGVGGTLTSRHYDIIVLDDLVTIKDRFSPATRKEKAAWIQEIQNIKDPDGHIIAIGTPWHEFDAYTDMEEAGFQVIKFPIETVPLPHITPEFIAEKKRKLTPAIYAANYLLKHVADKDRVFPAPILKKTPSGLRCRGYIDPSFGGKDQTAISIGGKIEERLHVAYGVVWHDSIENHYEDIKKLWNMFHIDYFVCEANAAQRLVASALRRKGVPCREKHNMKNKYFRIVDTLRAPWSDGLITFDENIHELYIKQIEDYTEFEEVDDAPDSLAGLRESLFNKKAALIG